MARLIIIGLMGPGEQANREQTTLAYALGAAIAAAGWVLLTGGRNVGVMDAASHGASARGGLTIGILPGDNLDQVSSAIDIPLVTGLGQARNVINVLSSQVVIACGLGPGTAAEIALAIKAGKLVLLMAIEASTVTVFQALGQPGQVREISTPAEAVTIIRNILLPP